MGMKMKTHAYYIFRSLVVTWILLYGFGNEGNLYGFRKIRSGFLLRANNIYQRPLERFLSVVVAALKLPKLLKSNLFNFYLLTMQNLVWTDLSSHGTGTRSSGEMFRPARDSPWIGTVHCTCTVHDRKANSLVWVQFVSDIGSSFHKNNTCIEVTFLPWAKQARQQRMNHRQH